MPHFEAGGVMKIISSVEKKTTPKHTHKNNKNLYVMFVVMRKSRKKNY
jgi:hypothetical protein